MLHISEPDIITRVEEIRAKIAGVKAAIGRVIFGQEQVIELVLVNILAGGHALLSSR